MKAIRVRGVGGPELLTLEDVEKPQAGPGQAVVQIKAAGLNFIDVYFRKGLYPSAQPYTPGQEAAGVVESVGAGVSHVRPGDRVAWAGGPGSGTYAQFASVAAGRLIKIPESLDFKQAAAAMLQGMTAHYLTHSTYAVQKGDWCLVHAAAGGVGLLMCQLIRRLGGRAIGTAGSQQKAALAREAGAEAVVLYQKEDVVAEVKKITGGAGVKAAYDSVGKDMYLKSLECLAPRGMLVLYGQSSGPVPPIDPQLLNQKGSVFLTRPSLAHYTAAREELEQRAGDVLGWIAAGQLELRIDSEFALERAADAHRKLEGRQTAGKVLLIP